MKKVFSFILFLTLLVSCQNDISGRYKSINPTKGFIREEIYIDWNGEITGDKLFIRDVYGKSVEYYGNHSWENPQSVKCEFVYNVSAVGTLDKKGDKYIASNLIANVEIDESSFSTSSTGWPRPNITDKELIDYYEQSILDSLPSLDGITYGFKVKGDKLILIGGNEVDDYFIKLVD